MVKFDDKGQGYFDFIFENCSKEMAKAIQKDLLRDTVMPGIIISTEKGVSYTTVIIDFYGYFSIHRETIDKDFDTYQHHVVFANELKIMFEHNEERGNLRDRY